MGAMTIRDLGSTSNLVPKPRVASPTRPLDPRAVETSTLQRIESGALNAGQQVYQAFDKVVHDPKLATGVVMSAGAAFALADRLNQMRSDGKTLSTGDKMSNAGSALFPLAGVVARATGHAGVATVADRADATNRGIKRTKDAHDSISKGIAALSKTRDGAAQVGKTADAVKGAQGLSKLGKLAAGADVARGVISGVSLVGDVREIINDPGKLKDPSFAVKTAYDTLGTANGALAAAKLAGKAGIVGKLNPVTGLAFSAAGIASNAIDIKKNGLNLNNGLGLAANSLDLAGNALIMSGVGAPVGMILKGVGAGAAVAQLAVQNWPAIKETGKKVGKAVASAASAVAEGVSNAASHVANKVADKASAALDTLSGGLKKAFSGW